MVWLPDGEKNSKICLFVLTWSTDGQTDGQTERRTDIAWRNIPRLCIASRGENEKNKCIRETILKDPLAEAQTRNTFCGMRVCVPVPKFCKKNSFPRKTSLKSDNWLLSYDHKRFSIWRPSAILNFKILKFLYLVTSLTQLSSSSKPAVDYKISSKSNDFSLRYADLTNFKMVDVRHLKFYGPGMGSSKSSWGSSYWWSIDHF